MTIGVRGMIVVGPFRKQSRARLILNCEISRMLPRPCRRKTEIKVIIVQLVWEARGVDGMRNVVCLVYKYPLPKDMSLKGQLSDIAAKCEGDTRGYCSRSLLITPVDGAMESYCVRLVFLFLPTSQIGTR